MDALLRPIEVCRLLGVSRTWLYDAAKTGRIPSVRIGGPGGPVRFIRTDLETWLRSARSEVRAELGESARESPVRSAG